MINSRTLEQRLRHKHQGLAGAQLVNVDGPDAADIISLLRETLTQVLAFADQSNVNEYAKCPECSEIEALTQSVLRRIGER